jgi:hypothetical protein
LKIKNTFKQSKRFTQINFCSQLLLTLIFIVGFTPSIFSQEDNGSTEFKETNLKNKKTYKYKSFFGICYKPTFPTRVFKSGPLVLQSDSISAEVKPTFGYTFGFNVRIGLSKKFSIESGLNMIQRNYKITYNMSDTINATNDLNVLNYEIPINALVYIQLSKSIFASTSAGTSLSFYPSELTTQIVVGKHRFTQEGRRYHRLGFDINANVGFEYRTLKNGTFYAGFAAKIPSRPILATATIHEAYDQKVALIGNLTGTQLSIDFKYFFHNKPKKGPQPNIGPISQ